MTLRISKVFTYDEDAGNYIQAVEAADGQALEGATRQAINNFVIGCKQDGIWTAIKASCILAGARTLAGALVPLVGAAPTRQGTEAGWSYSRKTGLQGNASNNYLNSNRLINADPTLNQHVSVYLSSYAVNTWLGAATGNNGYTSVESTGIYCGSTTNVSVPAGTTGLIGASRSDNVRHSGRRASATLTTNNSANTKNNASSYPVFAYWNGSSLLAYTSARIAFYSIGEALDLALLDARVTALINALSAAIP